MLAIGINYPDLKSSYLAEKIHSTFASLSTHAQMEDVDISKVLAFGFHFLPTYSASMTKWHFFMPSKTS